MLWTVTAARPSFEVLQKQHQQNLLSKSVETIVTWKIAGIKKTGLSLLYNFAPGKEQEVL